MGAAPGPAFHALRLDGLQRDFGALNALKGLDLTIQRGEFIALLGPSGCGKSTALNCIAGLLPLTGGSIWLDERRIDTLRPEERGFGMVFQNYALFPHLTARRNIGFGLRMRGVPKPELERRVDAAIAMVRLESQSEKLPGQMSGGQQQRVAIARAVVVEPPLVLMDEPLSNLDAKLRIEMRQEIRRIHNQLGTTTIYVTHDQEEALSLADRIVVLRDGRIRQVGAPEELYARPAHLDVAEFMGYRTRLAARILARDGDVLTLDLGIGQLQGIEAAPIAGETATLALRPDDLQPVAEGTPHLRAQVEAVEFIGREFHGLARSARGDALHFRAAERPALGETLCLGADPRRVLAYPEMQP
ncbi:spermidine/putrescine ABC transporter ATP-binding protein [Pseudoroseomonas deserti]|uniref:Spermidine/putrescine ABC transporter ATP-binding protein n=1 Tax=Teichococcus deserti TaxID=1817963 RepID=A0A1V2H8I6_9PROT|nr:ABC transporter ATP-binding protein [Pseudoroseomonas deserti]ONG59117.1 spermidine/putrescine ABC transporter ATP-binding protein [Pseudoroseomonas deserti]